MRKKIIWIAALLTAAMLSGCDTLANSSSDQESAASASDPEALIETAENETSEPVSTAAVTEIPTTTAPTDTVPKDTDTETTETNSTQTTASGFSYSVSDVAGTWYLNGDLASDRMTIDYDGHFTNVSQDGTITSGQIKIESNPEEDGSTSYGYAFYRTDGTLWYAFPALGDIPVCHLYEGMTGIPHYQSESDLVRTNENLWKYFNSLEGTYCRKENSSAEQYVIDAHGAFKQTSSDGTLLQDGDVVLTSVVNPDGTTALCGNLQSRQGEILLTFPIKNILNLCAGMEDAGYSKIQ